MCNHTGVFASSISLHVSSISQEQRSSGAPRASSSTSLAGFSVGMRLEAKDRLNPSMVAVVTVTDIKDGQLLIHFDGWTNSYDYWCKPTSADIHPKGWCARQGRTLHAPQGEPTFPLCTCVYMWSIVE